MSNCDEDSEDENWLGLIRELLIYLRIIKEIQYYVCDIILYEFIQDVYYCL